MPTRQFWNGSRHDPKSRAGFYESYFQRANHPSRPRAFWIRYTIFTPKGAPEQAEAELWAIWFDAEAGEVLSLYRAYPLAEASFAKDELRVNIAGAELSERHLRGEIEDGAKKLAWDLTFTGDAPALLLAPEAFYERSLPKAKVLVGLPLARYDGVLRFAGGREERIDGWVGSQNHNWGTKHTDLYAWGQVAGFDDAPDTFLECATAKIKIGPFWLPKLSPLVWREGGKEYALNTPRCLMKNRGAYSDWRWQVDAHAEGISVRAVFSAPKDRFAVLGYRNPPGGVKRCLNAKIARCEVTVKKQGEADRTLVSAHGAAFEILGDPARLDALGFKPA